MNYEFRQDSVSINLSHDQALALRDDVVFARFAMAKQPGLIPSQTFSELEQILRSICSPSEGLWETQAFEYSHWLDDNGYITAGEETHEELVSQFFHDQYNQ